LRGIPFTFVQKARKPRQEEDFKPHRLRKLPGELGQANLAKSDFPVRKAKERQPSSTAAIKSKVMA
jgi:hypothetical protein